MEDETLKEILGEEENKTIEYVPSYEDIMADIEARLDYDDFPSSGCTTSNISLSEDYDEEKYICGMTNWELLLEFFDEDACLSVTQKKGIITTLLSRGVLNKEEYQIELTKI